MRESRCLAGLALAVLGLAVGPRTPGRAAPANLVANPSFEDFKEGAPEHWTISPKVAASVDPGKPFEGRRALHLRQMEGASYALATQAVAVKPNAGYRLRAAVRAPRASYYTLVAYKPGLNGLATKSTGWAEIRDWLVLDIPFRTEEQTTIYVGLLAWGPEASWDAVEMVEDNTVRVGDLSPTGAPSLPAPTPDEGQRGFLTFTRPLHHFTSARQIPTRRECAAPVAAATPAGEAETLMVMLHALRDLARVDAVPAGPLTARDGARLPAGAVEVFRLGYSRRELTSQSYVRFPLLLLPSRPEDVAAGDCAQIAVRVTVPPGARPGDYSTALRIRVAGSTACSVPLHLKVLPVRLDPADITYMMYYSDTYLEPDMATPELQARYYRDMAAHGMNSVSLYVVPERAQGEGYAIDLDHDYGRKPEDPRHALGMRQRLAQMKAAGLVSAQRPLVLISGGTALYDWGAFGGGPESVRSLMRRGRELGWPPLLFYVHDEPGEEARNAAVRRAFRACYAPVPEARTVTAIGDEGIEAVGGLYDVWIAATASIRPELIERARRAGKDLWAYDCRYRGQRAQMDRYLCGLYAWATGVRGVCQWAYYGTKKLQRGPDGQLVVPQDWNEWYMAPSDEGQIGTIGWEARREGVEDYRTLKTLARLAGRADPATRARAERLFAEVRRLAPVDGYARAPSDFRFLWEFDPAPAMRPADFDRIRATARMLIAGLQRPAPPAGRRVRSTRRQPR